MTSFGGQEFLCRCVDCVWHRDASGQVDGCRQRVGWGTIPHRWGGCASVVSSPSGQGGNALPRHDDSARVEPVVARRIMTASAESLGVNLVHYDVNMNCFPGPF